MSNVRPPLLAVLNISFNAHVANQACKMAAPTLQEKIGADRI